MNTQIEPYTDRQRKHNQELGAALAKDIRKKCDQLSDELKGIAGSAIISANLTREIGMELREWLGRDQMRFEEFEGFFRSHKADLPEWFNAASARRFIAAYEAHPEPITDFRTAKIVMDQQTFFSVGLLEEPKRSGPQTASGRTAMEIFVLVAGKEREALKKLEDEIPRADWDESIWETIAIATKETAELHEAAEKVLHRSI